MTRSRSGRRRNAVALGATPALLPAARLAAPAAHAAHADPLPSPSGRPAHHHENGADWKQVSSAITAGHPCPGAPADTLYDGATTA
ncbi:hypothetical protein [Streptomyces sp. HUAS TT7]|uniref:hypothetical protein n=1 Tax=Streptomyces sp. HUAS TT7 TaxID=3447507 RepID=UPI003F65CF5F